MKYATYKSRLLATLIDSAINILFVSLLLYFALSQTNISSTITALLILLVVLFNPVIMFSSVLFVHFLGGTPGKLLTGLRILNTNGKRLSFKRILFRQTIGYSFSWIFFGTGFYSIIKDEKKQGWHDKTVGSVVTTKGNMFVVALSVLILLYISAFYILFNSVKTFSKGPVIKEIQGLIKEEMAKEKARNSSKKTDADYNFNYKSKSEFKYEYNYPDDYNSY